MAKRGPKVPRSDVWERMFREQQHLFSKVAEDEEFKHCMDKVSFKGAYYDPEKVISNYGRVWSLRSHSYRRQGNNDYFKIEVSAAGRRHNPNKYMLLHRLVANYFCPKDAVDIYGEANVEVNHGMSLTRTLPYHKAESDDNRKIYICYYKNLEWVEKTHDHRKITNLQHHKLPEDQEDGILYMSAREHPLSEVQIATRKEELSDEKLKELGLSAEEAAKTEHLVRKTERVKVVFTETEKTKPELPKREELKKIVDPSQPAVIVTDNEVDNT